LLLQGHSYVHILSLLISTNNNFCFTISAQTEISHKTDSPQDIKICMAQNLPTADRVSAVLIPHSPSPFFQHNLSPGADNTSRANLTHN
jgi:hypothetical protein